MRNNDTRYHPPNATSFTATSVCSRYKICKINYLGLNVRQELQNAGNFFWKRLES